jgi:micrococcal nuclease
MALIITGSCLSQPSLAQHSLKQIGQGQLSVNTHETPSGIASEDELIFPKAPDMASLMGPSQIVIRTVIDPLRYQLQNGDVIQLTGLELPDLNSADVGPHALAAHKFLSEKLVNQKVQLYVTKDPGKGRLNRMGHKLGHIITDPDDGYWLQGFLIANGFARVQSMLSHPEMQSEMIALEDMARDQKIGIWADPAFAVKNVDNAHEAFNSFGIVEGKIHSVAARNNVIYLNFGPDWKTDFTIALDTSLRREFTKKQQDPLQWSGKNVRVRGWIENYNGPHIKLDAVHNLEFIK